MGWRDQKPDLGCWVSQELLDDVIVVVIIIIIIPQIQSLIFSVPLKPVCLPFIPSFPRQRCYGDKRKTTVVGREDRELPRDERFL